MKYDGYSRLLWAYRTGYADKKYIKDSIGIFITRWDYAKLMQEIENDKKEKTNKPVI